MDTVNLLEDLFILLGLLQILPLFKTFILESSLFLPWLGGVLGLSYVLSSTLRVPLPGFVLLFHVFLICPYGLLSCLKAMYLFWYLFFLTVFLITLVEITSFSWSSQVISYILEHISFFVPTKFWHNRLCSFKVASKWLFLFLLVPSCTKFIGGFLGLFHLSIFPGSKYYFFSHLFFFFSWSSSKHLLLSLQVFLGHPCVFSL